MGLTNDIATFRRAILDSGDFNPILRRLCAEHGEAVVRPLLTVFSFEENGDHHEAMYSLVHTIEGYGNDVYMEALIEEAPRIASNSPLLGAWLLGRICSSDSHFDIFMEKMRHRPREAKRAVVALFGLAARQFANKSALVDRAKSAVGQLAQS